MREVWSVSVTSSCAYSNLTRQMWTANCSCQSPDGPYSLPPQWSRKTGSNKWNNTEITGIDGRWWGWIKKKKLHNSVPSLLHSQKISILNCTFPCRFGGTSFVNLVYSHITRLKWYKPDFLLSCDPDLIDIKIWFFKNQTQVTFIWSPRS